MHWSPADRVWYLVLVQAYLEQGRAKGDRPWCHGVVLTNGCKPQTDNKWAVYRGVKELSVDERVRTYDIGLHTVYCHYPRGVAGIPEPKEGRVVRRSGVEGEPPQAGAAAVQVKGVGKKTEVIVDKVVYRATSHREVQTVADLVRRLGEDVNEVLMVVDAAADMASRRRLATKPLHEALGTELASQVYTIWHGLEIRSVLLVIHLVKQESHSAGVGNHEANGAIQAVDKEHDPDWRVPDRKEHLHMMHIPRGSCRQRESHIGGGGGQGQEGVKSVPAASAYASAGERGAGSGSAEETLGGQGGTAGPLPQRNLAGNTARKAANQAAPGHHGSSASEGDYCELVQA